MGVWTGLGSSIGVGGLCVFVWCFGLGYMVT